MTSHLTQIDANYVTIGQGSFIHPTVSISGSSGPAESVRIGANVYIGEGVQIMCPDFTIGDYGKIQKYTTIHGYMPCVIGHNAWIGQFTVVDCIAGTSIGNNCGIGAHSQLWTHIKYGDILAGCRFNSSRPLRIGNDVWFVGHCIVSPIDAADRSMAMVGSVITADMLENTVYAGVPARAISSKVGFQFVETSIDERMSILQKYVVEFRASGGETEQLVIVEKAEDVRENNMSYFVVSDRTYSRRLTEQEIAFMKFLLPDRAKFTPFA